jgi:AcrR family transcriptional regulator
VVPFVEEAAGKRSDARRNQTRVLAAAIEVFTERGIEATIPQVAARAGVGKATVYRSYPTKADLIRSIARVHVQWLMTRICEATQGPDPYEALSSLLLDIATRLAEDRLMIEVVMRVNDRWADDGEGAQRLGGLLAAARDQGMLREDVTVADLQVLMGGFAHMLIELGNRDPAVWRRYATLTLAALRP